MIVPIGRTGLKLCGRAHRVARTAGLLCLTAWFAVASIGLPDDLLAPGAADGCCSGPGINPARGRGCRCATAGPGGKQCGCCRPQMAGSCCSTVQAPQLMAEHEPPGCCRAPAEPNVPVGAIAKSGCCSSDNVPEAPTTDPEQDARLYWAACGCGDGKIPGLLICSDPRSVVPGPVMIDPGLPGAAVGLGTPHVPTVCLLPATPPPKFAG